MKRVKRAYDVYDFPWQEQVKTPSGQAAPEPKVRKKPGPKPRVQLVSEPSVAPAPPKLEGAGLIQKLVDELRPLFVKLDIRNPKPKVNIPESQPTGYISNIILDKHRIGYLEQQIDGDKVYLKFEKGANIPIWHDGDDIGHFAEKITHEIEKYYTRSLAARVGYRTAIRVAAHRRRLG